MSIFEALRAQWAATEAVGERANEVMQRARAVMQVCVEQKILLQVLWDLAVAHQPDQDGSMCTGCGQPWMCTTAQMINSRILPASQVAEAGTAARDGPPPSAPVP